LKKQWGGYAGFDGWFAGELNNAFFVPVSEYYGWLPAFRALLKQSPDMPTFYDETRALAALDARTRSQRLRALMDGGPSPEEVNHETGGRWEDHRNQ